jgi:hypothetical protein
MKRRKRERAGEKEKGSCGEKSARRRRAGRSERGRRRGVGKKWRAVGALTWTEG